MKTGQDAFGRISLRSAIQAANAKRNADSIILPAGKEMVSIQTQFPQADDQDPIQHGLKPARPK